MAKKKFNPLTPPFDLTADSVNDLTDHTKVVHDALGIDAHTVDGIHAYEKAPVSDGVSQNSINSLNDVTISSAIVDNVLKYNGSEWINSTVNTASAGAGVLYFFCDTPSDLATFEVIQKVPDSDIEQDESQAVTNQTIEFERYASPLGGLGGTAIDAGQWEFEIYTYVSDAADVSELLFGVYSRTVGGIETLLFSLTTGNIDALTPTLYQIFSVQQAFSITATDRLVVRVSAKTNSGTAKTVHFIHSGTVHYSNITTPLVIRHNELIGLQGGSSTERYHLTSAENTKVAALNVIRTITFIIDGGGIVITTGVKGFIEVPFACTIVAWTLMANVSGSIVIDVWKDTYANFPPTILDTITGTEKPTLVSVQKNQDIALTTWTTAISAGDILAFNVDSVDTIQRATLSLKVST